MAEHPEQPSRAPGPATPKPADRPEPRDPPRQNPSDKPGRDESAGQTREPGHDQA